MVSRTEASGRSWRECRIELPAPESWLVFDLDTGDPQVWARSVAEEHVGADAPSDRRDAFAEDVLWYWTAAIRQQALCAALLVPPGSSVLASYTVRELHVSPELLCLEAFRREAELAEGPFFGKPAISEVDLPTGSAIRVHRLEPSAPGSEDGEVLEGVAHYILPRLHPAALESRLLWTSLGLGDELATVADALAESIRLV